MIGLLAAIRSADPSAAPALAPGATPSVEIRDIAPPVEFSSLLPWQMALLLAAGALLLGLLIAGLVWWLRRRPRRPAAPPPTPRQTALAALERLRAQVRTLAPYDFSIAVSEVLRTFIERQHRLRALEQTSPEFLASLAGAPQFTEADRGLLAAFLERCDLIKFARVEAGVETSEELLGSATAFVQGGPS